MKNWIDVLKILAECTEEAELDMDGLAVARIEAIRQYVQKQQRLLLVDPLLLMPVATPPPTGRRGWNRI